MAVVLSNGVGYTLGAANDEVTFRHRISSITIKGGAAAGNVVLQVKTAANQPGAAYTTLFDVTTPANDTLVLAASCPIGPVDAVKLLTLTTATLVMVTIESNEY